jgi:hypothetical protein
LILHFLHLEGKKKGEELGRGLGLYNWNGSAHQARIKIYYTATHYRLIFDRKRDRHYPAICRNFDVGLDKKRKNRRHFSKQKTHPKHTDNTHTHKGHPAIAVKTHVVQRPSTHLIVDAWS